MVNGGRVKIKQILRKILSRTRYVFFSIFFNDFNKNPTINELSQAAKMRAMKYISFNG